MENLYETPKIEFIEINVEKGFANSPTFGIDDPEDQPE